MGLLDGAEDNVVDGARGRLMIGVGALLPFCSLLSGRNSFRTGFTPLNKVDEYAKSLSTSCSADAASFTRNGKSTIELKEIFENSMIATLGLSTKVGLCLPNRLVDVSTGEVGYYLFDVSLYCPLGAREKTE